MGGQVACGPSIPHKDLGEGGENGSLASNDQTHSFWYNQGHFCPDP